MMLLSNYLRVGLRNLLRHKTYSAINVAGLSVGLCTALLILLFIKFEYSFDGFHTRADSIYRVSIISKREGVVEYDSPIFVAPLGPALAAEFPEVELYSRISTPRTEYFFEGGEAQKVSGLVYADSSFFELFSFSLMAGDRDRVLSAPYSMVLTEETAQRIFGETNPIGRMLRSQRGETYTVTGIVQKPPENSHIRFNALVSFSTLYRNPNNFMGWNGGNQYAAYIGLHEGAAPAEVEKKLPPFMWAHINQELAALNIKYESYLQPLRRIHLQYGDSTGANMLTIYIFASIGGVILLIACINFINLTLARATKRSREVGIRKTLGAGRSSLIQQFMLESILLCFIALLFSLLLSESVYPIFREMLGRNFAIAGKITFLNMLGLAGLLLLVGIMAGSYPAFYLASLPAVRSLKHPDSQRRRKASFRNALIVFQFAATVTLMVSAVLIHLQINFVQNRDPGFEKENLMVVPLLHEEVQLKAELLKTELSRLQGVAGISASSEVPINGFTSNGYFPEGFTSPVLIKVVDVDQDFLKTFGINLVQGRNFASEQRTDEEAYLINESLTALLRWDNPIGKIIRRNGDHPIIGVVKNFNYASLHSPVEPLILTNHPWQDRFANLSIRIESSDVQKTLASLERTWKGITPDIPFEYWFLSDGYSYLYADEKRFDMIITYFSGVALIIGLFGLYSLTAFSVENRTKEIGIRKVLGATVASLVDLVFREFAVLLIISCAIAAPIAYAIMSRWLQHFAYRIEINLLIFLVVAILILGLAAATVSYHAIKAALANPVKSLRYE